MEHIGINNTDIKIAILVGDPQRVDTICESIGKYKKLGSKRGYIIAEIEYENHSFLVVSTGIGSPSIAIAIEELYLIGIRVFIRIGTCGAIQKEINPGSIILSTGSIREEGTSAQYVDLCYPAVPDLDLSYIFKESLSKYSGIFFHGITHSKDSFYSEKSQLQLSDDHKKKWIKWRNAGVLATDMETSCLFILSKLRKAKSCSILVSVGVDKSDDRIQRAFNFIFESLLRSLELIENLSFEKKKLNIDPLNSYL